MRSFRRDNLVVPSVRLVCFPYGGSGGTAFRGWTDYLPVDVELVVFNLPGRESRFNEPPHRRLGPLLDTVLADIAEIAAEPLVLFGHSMGALIAFEVARALSAIHQKPPVGLLVSGHRAPHLPRERAALHELTDAELMHEIRKLGALTDTLASDELAALMLPTLRADCELTETYVFQPTYRLDCPIVVFGGEDDMDAPPKALAAWSEHTSGSCRLVLFPGGHFFFERRLDEFLRSVSQEIRAIAART